GGEGWQFCFGDRNDALSALLQCHRSRRNLDFEPPVSGANLERLPRLEIEHLAQGLWHDDPTSRVYGGFHGITIPLKLVWREPCSRRLSADCRASPLSHVAAHCPTCREFSHSDRTWPVRQRYHADPARNPDGFDSHHPLHLMLPPIVVRCP